MGALEASSDLQCMYYRGKQLLNEMHPIGFKGGLESLSYSLHAGLKAR